MSFVLSSLVPVLEETVEERDRAAQEEEACRRLPDVEGTQALPNDKQSAASKPRNSKAEVILDETMVDQQHGIVLGGFGLMQNENENEK
jgi:hypothetical protein